MTRCWNCHQDTPEGNFCVRCGACLSDEQRHRLHPLSSFAAAPHELAAVPYLVSTLFPHLPRSSHWALRLALALGAAVVAVLAVLRLFPLALIAAALILPVLVLLYLVDVNVYEDEPAWVLGLTVAWGAAAGVGAGLVARASGPSATVVLVHGQSQYLLGQGILIPSVGLLVVLLGPMVLLRYHRFNELLDGVTFGAAAAAAYGGAEAITVAAGFLGSGLRPQEAVLSWLWRLLALGLGLPVLTMGAAALICTSLWLRYRASARDARALGRSGHPAVALIVGIALVVLAAVGELILPVGAWLAWLFVLDLLAILALRRGIHLGLLQESLEISIGPQFTCPNCGQGTARHTFCQSCGISLQALPKSVGIPAGGAMPVAGGI